MICGVNANANSPHLPHCQSTEWISLPRTALIGPNSASPKTTSPSADHKFEQSH